jgi:hypothetical protein
MDSLVATRLWRVVVINEDGQRYMVGQDNRERVPLPAFSTVIDDAYRVVDFFSAKGWEFRIQHIPESDTYNSCFYRDDSRVYQMVNAKTTTMAVCLAALQALNGSNVKFA